MRCRFNPHISRIELIRFALWGHEFEPNESALPEGTFRIVRLEFVTPEGEPYELYARNVRVESTPHLERFHLAYTDPKGRWKINSHDLLTGRVEQTEFTLRA